MNWQRRGGWRPVRVALRRDNALDRSLGNTTSTLQLSLNSLLGLGETIYGYAATSDPLRPFASYTQVRVLGAGLIIARGDGRLTLNPEVTLSRTLPTAPAGVPRSEGRLLRYALRFGYLLTETRVRRVAIDFSVEALDQRTTALDFATDFARDHYAVARLGVSGAHTGHAATWSLSAQLGQGLGIIGKNGGVPPTRQGASAQFTKVTVQTRGELAVAPRLTVTGTAFIQSSFGRPLLRAEQFQLEGNEAVSAFVGGVTTVDEGATVRVETSRRQQVGPFVLAPYVFGAAGYGRIARPTVVEAQFLYVAAVGFGMRVATHGGAIQLGIEQAFGFANLPTLTRALSKQMHRHLPDWLDSSAASSRSVF